MANRLSVLLNSFYFQSFKKIAENLVFNNKGFGCRMVIECDDLNKQRIGFDRKK